MGTVVNQYLMLGVKLNYDEKIPALEQKIEQENLDRSEYNELRFNFLDKYHDNGYQKEIKHYNGLCVIDDGMNTEYVFIGRLLAKSTPGKMIDGVFHMKPDETLKEIVKELISAQFGFENLEVEMWLFSHYH